MTSMRKRRNDDPRLELAKVIRIIIGDTMIGQVAGLLGTPRARFACFLRGEAYVTRSTVIRQDWQGKLSQAFPEAWASHAKEFQRALALQHAHTGARPRLPERHYPFAVALGRLLGLSSRRSVAAALGISSSHLSRVLRGHALVSQEHVARWCPVLRRLLPDQWSMHGQAVELAYGNLPERLQRAPRGSSSMPQ